MTSIGITVSGTMGRGTRRIAPSLRRVPVVAGIVGAAVVGAAALAIWLGGAPSAMDRTSVEPVASTVTWPFVAIDQTTAPPERAAFWVDEGVEPGFIVEEISTTPPERAIAPLVGVFPAAVVAIDASTAPPERLHPTAIGPLNGVSAAEDASTAPPERIAGMALRPPGILTEDASTAPPER